MNCLSCLVSAVCVSDGCPLSIYDQLLLPAYKEGGVPGELVVSLMVVHICSLSVSCLSISDQPTRKENICFAKLAIAN